MRKLIVVLLIAFIACVEVDTTPKEEVSDFKEFLDLLDLDTDSVELINPWIEDPFKKIKINIKKVLDYLDKVGILDQLIPLAKTGSKYSFNVLCSKYFTTALCERILKALKHDLKKYK